MFKKLRFLSPYVFSILFLVCAVGVTHAAENIVRTIQIQYPSKQISGSTTVVGVPGCQYTFTVVGNLPEGTHIEWKGHTTTKGSWSGNVLYPYQSGGGSGTYHIMAELVGGGGGGGSGWSVAVNGTITDPILTYSEPGEDTYFAKDQTTPTPQADLKVTVTKPGGTKLQGVSVLFIAKRSNNSVVSIGSNSSNSSGEATKTWNVPVSAIEVYTLKAGTGSNPESLENEVTGKKVYIFEVEIDQPTSFPAYVYGNEELQLGSKVNPVAAEGGTYVWSKASGPGSVTFSPNNTTEDPKFKASTIGTYQVKVEYTKGEGTAVDTSGDIKSVEFDDFVIDGHRIHLDLPNPYPYRIEVWRESLEDNNGDNWGASHPDILRYDWSRCNGSGGITYPPTSVYMFSGEYTEATQTGTWCVVHHCLQPVPKSEQSNTKMFYW